MKLGRRLAIPQRDTPQQSREAKAIAALREVASILGRSPSVREYRRLQQQHPAADWPAEASIRRWLGGGWNDALERAHLDCVPEPLAAVKPLPAPFSREETIAACRSTPPRRKGPCTSMAMCAGRGAPTSRAGRGGGLLRRASSSVSLADSQPRFSRRRSSGSPARVFTAPGATVAGSPTATRSLSVESRGRVYRALHAVLEPQPTAAERRSERLSPLATMIGAARRRKGSSARLIDRDEYDRAGQTALSSARH